MRLFSLTAVFAVAMIPVLGGCAVAQSRPTPPRPITEVAREERGQILTVRDTRIDLSTGNARSLRAHTPAVPVGPIGVRLRSEEHTSELQSPCNLVCRLLLEKKKKTQSQIQALQ